jgi:hypothetical protein
MWLSRTIDISEKQFEPFSKIVSIEDCVIGSRAHGKAAGNRYSQWSQLLDHFSQGSGFSVER